MNDNYFILDNSIISENNLSGDGQIAYALIQSIYSCRTYAPIHSKDLSTYLFESDGIKHKAIIDRGLRELQEKGLIIAHEELNNWFDVKKLKHENSKSFKIGSISEFKELLNQNPPIKPSAMFVVYVTLNSIKNFAQARKSKIYKTSYLNLAKKANISLNSIKKGMKFLKEVGIIYFDNNDYFNKSTRSHDRSLLIGDVENKKIIDSSVRKTIKRDNSFFDRSIFTKYIHIKNGKLYKAEEAKAVYDYMIEYNQIISEQNKKFLESGCTDRLKKTQSLTPFKNFNFYRKKDEPKAFYESQDFDPLPSFSENENDFTDLDNIEDLDSLDSMNLPF